MARQVIIRIDQWVRSGLELLQRLSNDWEDIVATFFSGDAPGVLTSIHGGAGDSHNDGRSVHVLTFSLGHRLVYKPRSLQVEVCFQKLLQWLNDRGNFPPFRTLNVVDRGTYGWVEFVHAASCQGEGEVKRFYERQGAYLALLYAFEATDFHFENLIAAGEHPVLIDLESLFHTVPKVEEDGLEAQPLANRILMNSVLKVGLLPRRIWSNTAQKEGVELSGMGGAKGQMTPYPVPSMENIGTDAMRFVRKRVEMPGQQNRPTLNDTDIDTLDYTEEIVAGFTKMYGLIVEQRSDLLKDRGPVADFADVEVRYIARATRFYGLRLFESYHPDLLRDALERDRFFSNLWLHTKYNQSLGRLVPSELEDLYRGDIPVFTTRPNSRHLQDSSERQIDDFFEVSGLELVCQRIEQMNEDDLKQQIWFIRSSLTALAMGETMDPDKNVKMPASSTQVLSIDSEDYLTVASGVGDRLAQLALLGRKDVAWFGVQMVEEKFWTLMPLGTGLYDGLSGVALYLGYLGTITGDERYTELAERSLYTLQQHYSALKKIFHSLPVGNPVPLSPFSDSPANAVYLYSHLGMLWNRPELFSDAEELVELIKPHIESDTKLDIITGAAGCIGALAALYRCKPSSTTLEAARQCGERLIAQAKPQEVGVAWTDTVAEAVRPLTGFSHGASGIAWALLELSTLTGEEQFREVALRALAYERSVFLSELGNWPDFREESDTSDQKQSKDEAKDVKHMMAWCHGAPGIGLSRLAMLKHVNESFIYEDIETAIKTTLVSGFGTNHSMCHGDLGNLELLLKASQSLGDAALHKATYSRAKDILIDIRDKGARTGVPLGVETPGLMTGIAGIGYQLLRLAAPERVPSVLLLEPPILQGGRYV